MKTRRFSILASIVLSVMFLPSVFGNHRTGKLALPELLVAGDFDGDGNLDLAVNAPDEGKIILHFGDGKGNFAVPATELEDYPHPFGLAAGDFNGDNNLGVVTTTRTGINPGTAHVAILLGDGNGGFSQSAFLGVTSRPSSVAVGDLNGDTKLEFVVAGAGPPNN